MVGPEIKRGWQRTANISRKGCSLHVYRRGRWGLLLSNQNHSLVYAYCTFWPVGGTSRLWFEACCLLSSIFNLLHLPPVSAVARPHVRHLPTPITSHQKLASSLDIRHTLSHLLFNFRHGLPTSKYPLSTRFGLFHFLFLSFLIRWGGDCEDAAQAIQHYYFGISKNVLPNFSCF